MSRSRRRIAVLILTHFAAVFLFRWLAAAVTLVGRRQDKPIYSLFVALIVSQICLIGIWVGLSRKSWQQRSLIGFLCVAFVTGMLIFEEWHDPVGFHPFVPQKPIFAWIVPSVLALSISAFVVGALAIARRKCGLLKYDEPPPARKSISLQFSIRKTMMFTAFIAILLALWLFIKQQEFNTFGSLTGSMLMIVFVSFWFALVTLGAV